MSDLVDRLSGAEHPVDVTLRPERTVQALRECIERGYLHITFTNTRGGTELGVRLDRDLTDLSNADFGNQTGFARLVGGLTLDYVKVKCIAEVNLETLQGKGHLERMEG